MAARAPRSTRKVVGVTATVAVAFTALLFGGSTAAAADAVGLGSATSFGVLAGSTVTNTGPTNVAGDLGVSPGTAITGFPPGNVSDGTIHAADEVASIAQADVTAAYVDAAGRATTGAITADLAGQTLVGGVYTGPTLGLTGTLTLDAQGNPNAVFVFQAGSTLITGTGSSVSLINGASACNVTWQVGSSATLGTDSTMVGTILALTSITLDTGADVSGRVLARNGAVTLDSNTITRPDCSVISTTTTGSSTSTTQTPTSSTSTTAPTPTTSSSTTSPPLGTTTSTTSTPTTTSSSTTVPTTTSSTSSTSIPGPTSTTTPTTTSSTTQPAPTSTTSSTSIPGPSSTTSSTTSIPDNSTTTSSTTLPATTSSTTVPGSTSSTTLVDSGPTTIPGTSSTSSAPIRTFQTTSTPDTVVVEGTTTVPGGGSGGGGGATTTTTATGITTTTGGPSLPRTGTSSGPLTVAGVALLGLGGTLLLAARRRTALSR